MSLIQNAIQESVKEVLTELNVVEKPSNVIASKEDWEKTVDKYANTFSNKDPDFIETAVRKAFEIGQIALKPEWDIQKAKDDFVNGVRNKATTRSGIYNAPSYVQDNIDLRASNINTPDQEKPKEKYISIKDTPVLLGAHDRRMGKKTDAEINAELKRDALRRTGQREQKPNADAAWNNLANYIAREKQYESASEECLK